MKTDPQPGQRPVEDGILRKWIASCDPFTPIHPSDPRYFDLERVEAEGAFVSLRGRDHASSLATAIRLSEGWSCQLFSGFIGTGKSTELRRLVDELESDGYSVLLADAKEYHDLGRALSIEDLMIVNAGAFAEKTAARLERETLRDSFWHRLGEFFRHDVELGEFKIPLAVGDLKIGIKHAKPFWLQVREALSLSPGKLRAHCHDFIRQCAEEIAEKEPDSKGIVFVLDSLERLSAPTERFREVMQSVVRVLTEYSDFLRLPGCHVIYTVPPYVQMVNPGLRAFYDRVSHVLPAVKVIQRGPLKQPGPYQPGIQALAELVGQRIPIDEVFGERRDLLEMLVAYSGGHVRTLLLFIRELLYQASDSGLPPTLADIETVVQSFREPAKLRVWEESALLLDRVLDNGTLEGLSEESYGELARLMDDQIVLCYRYGDGWYDVQPLVRDHVRNLARKIRARRDG